MLGAMPRARGSLGNTPPIGRGRGENEGRRSVSRVERLLEQFLENFPGPARDFSSTRAKEHGAYSFSGASDPADAEAWLGKLESITEDGMPTR